ncbi:MAG TPA: RIP metalloprotease RseP [Acholeplasmataceae bacterium]|nr:RIP metalloprotease RseP [Acholeplasmataceae bacterium]
MDMIINILAFVFSLGIIIALHELGHFIFAKRANILCHEYAIGMGPVVYQKKKGETQYSLRAIPIGGFVSMAGEQIEQALIKKEQHVGLNFIDGKVSEIILNPTHVKHEQSLFITAYDLYDQADDGLFISGVSNQIEHRFEVLSDASYVFTEKKKMQIAPYNRSFESKTLWQRFLTIFAGPAMNFILAFFLFFVVAAFQGKPLERPMINEIVENNPAQIYGIQENDVIKSIGSFEIASWSQIGGALMHYAGSKDVPVKVLRDGNELVINVTPRVDINSMGLSNFDGNEIEYAPVGARVASVYGKAVGTDDKPLMMSGDVIISAKVVKTGVSHVILSFSDLIDFANQFEGGKVTFTVFRDETSLEVTYEIWEPGVLDSQDIPVYQSVLGISPDTGFNLGYTFTEGFRQIGRSAMQVVKVLGLLFGGSDQIGLNDMSGPVGIFNIVGSYAREGIIVLLWFIGFLSVNIGIMNLLPIPALDGGRLVFLGIEAVIRRPINKKVENTVNNVMFILLLVLFVYITFFDIGRIFA